MKADIRQTRLIHFPDEDISKVTVYRPDQVVLRISISAEIYSVYQNKILPIIVVGHVEIHKDNFILFSAIMHTKVLLSFDLNEQPVTQLMDMIKTVNEQEKTVWRAKVKGTYFEPLDFVHIPHNSEVYFNKAYEIIEAARKLHLLA